MASGNVKTWLVDIDGTLAIKGERGPFDWHRVGEDTPNTPVIDVVRSLIASGKEVRYVSGRMEQCRSATVEWLRHFVMSSTIPDDLFMRADGDYRPDTVVKRELFDKHIRGVYEIGGVIDDRAQVVKMWRDELGLTCLQVAPGDF